MDTNIEPKNGEISVITENGTTLIMNVDTLFELLNKFEAREEVSKCDDKTDEDDKCEPESKEADSEDLSGYMKLFKEILGVKDDENESDPDSDQDDEKDELEEYVPEDGIDYDEEDNSNSDEDFGKILTDDLFNEIINITNDKNTSTCKCDKRTCTCSKSKEKTQKNDKPAILVYEYNIPRHFNPDIYDFRKGIGKCVKSFSSAKDTAEVFNSTTGTHFTEENITNIADSWKTIGNMLHDGIIDEAKIGLSGDIKEYYEYLTGSKFPHKYIHLYTVDPATNKAYVFMWADKDGYPEFSDEILYGYTPDDEDED